MGIAIGDVRAFVTDTITDSDRRKSHVDKQGDMAVPQIMYANDLNARCLAAAKHFTVHIRFREWEKPVSITKSVKRVEILFHFLTEKIGHNDRSDALFGFGRRDNITPAKTLQGFSHRNGLGFKVEILPCESEKFTLADIPQILPLFPL